MQTPTELVIELRLGLPGRSCSKSFLSATVKPMNQFIVNKNRLVIVSLAILVGLTLFSVYGSIGQANTVATSFNQNWAPFQRTGDRVYLNTPAVQDCLAMSWDGRLMICSHPQFPQVKKSTDIGKMRVNNHPQDLSKFATPTLRNLTTSAPYFHGGSANTLEEVVALYSSWTMASKQNSAKVDEAMVLTPLAAEEQKALVAFLKSLSSN